MPDFSTMEISEQDGSTVLLIEFVSGGTTHRFCNQDKLVNLSGVDYYPATIVNSERNQTAERVQNDMKFSVPRYSPIVTPYIQKLPMILTSVTVKQVQWDGIAALSNAVYFWTGDVMSVSWDESEATISCQNTIGSMNKVGLRRKYQSTCSHFVYRGECGLNLATWSTTYACTAAAGDVLTLPSMPANIADYIAGIVSWQGQFRMIIEADFGAKTIRLLTPFDGFEGVENIDIALGCDHTMTVCDTRFGNLDNFGGFPFIPNENYFIVGLR